MFAKGGDRSQVAMLSLLSSISTSACISAQISWDWDIDEVNRDYSPEFYGFIPDGIRRQVTTIILMVLISFFNLVVR